MKPLLWCFWSAVALFNVTRGLQAQDADPPSRVARVAYLSGPVSFEPASVDQWEDASLNYPMTTGDNLYTAEGARGVLRIGRNSLILNASTNFQFVNLSDTVVQTSINSGSLSLRVRYLLDNESWEVDTPNGALTLLRPGDYRVDTDTSRNATMVTVRAGDIEVTANNQSFPVHAGQTAYFDDSGNPPDVQGANQGDDFDLFVSSRDRIEDAPAPQYISADMAGYEDLNANGTWRDTPDYGAVWTPRVAANWIPYQDGRWAWVEPWGWTWIDDEPWGFAPFHYGRWAYIDNSWGWVPGPVEARPYYAPALVAFVGGPGFGVGVSVGGGGLVAWFPLGPREPYYPSYHVSESYVRQVNVTNTRITNIDVTNINVTNINYVNRAATVAVPQNAFATAQPVRQAAVHIDPTQARQVQVIGSAPKVAPQRESVMVNANRHSAPPPPAALANRPVVAKLAPPPPVVPFAAKQQMLQQHPGTPVAPAQLQALRAQAPRQNPPAGRMAVQSINTKQIQQVTPTVRPGTAPSLAQRPAQRPNVPQTAPNQRPPQEIPPARPQDVPAGREQTPLPERQAPPARVQPMPPERQAPPPRQQAVPPERQAPPAREQAPPPERQIPPPRQQAPPPERQAPPAREQAPPPERQVPPPAREQRAEPPAREQAAPPARPAPPKKKDEKKTEPQ